jgi:hypothetical protein
MTEVCRVRRNECQESQEEVVSEQPRYLTRKCKVQLNNAQSYQRVVE